MYLFVGERKSPTARKRGWSWRDGRLAAKQLFDSLHRLNINPDRCRFANAFERGHITRIREHQQEGWTIIGMGKKAQDRLMQAGIPHKAMIHPAARGKIRNKDRYTEHVQQTLRS